jgi:hypothetical protein
MLSLRRLLAGACLWLAAFAPVHAQIDPTDPGSTNALQFEYSVQPTNDAILITLTTNVISITVSNAAAFTNVVITGTFGTNVVEFLDDGTPPDDAPGDGVFRGNLVAPFVEERQPLLVSLLLIGADIASVTNEPPADPPVMVTNRGSVSYIIVPRPRNDNFTNAFKLLSAGGVALGTNEYASLEPREPVHGQVAGNNQSVWWTWGAPADGPVLVDLAGTAFPAVLAVYEGPQLTNLVPVAASTNDPALNIPPHATFNARRGTTYRIAVSGIDTNSFGSIRLRVARPSFPSPRRPRTLWCRRNSSRSRGPRARRSPSIPGSAMW